MNNKFFWVLSSRKFWAAIVALLVTTGVLEASEAQEAELVQAILTVVTAISYILAVALEDGLSRR